MKKTLAAFHPKVAIELHPFWNTETPYTLSPGSNKKVWWLGSCGHEWEAKVCNRTSTNKQGCPYCAGVRVLVGFNDFASLVPEVAKMWHPTKNCFYPTEATSQSSKKLGLFVLSNMNGKWF